MVSALVDSLSFACHQLSLFAFYGPLAPLLKFSFCCAIAYVLLTENQHHLSDEVTIAHESLCLKSVEVATRLLFVSYSETSVMVVRSTYAAGSWNKHRYVIWPPDLIYFLALKLVFLLWDLSVIFFVKFVIITKWKITSFSNRKRFYWALAQEDFCYIKVFMLYDILRFYSVGCSSLTQLNLFYWGSIEPPINSNFSESHRSV